MKPEDELRNLRYENRVLKEELSRVSRERDRYKDRWLNSEDCWKPGTYQNGA